ncbi:Zn(II)/Cd(II)/Pb(II) translocating P-type ATPase ZntA, partial [Enterobacter hormaechei]|nr:Zn(II)/Cd(II)/Pb(II) translocating P-type ATPase ZntA [Enterobacter hormaechei]
MLEGKKDQIAATDSRTTPQFDAMEHAGQTVITVMQDGEPMGMLSLRDTMRDDEKEDVDALHRLGVKGVILTGDNP